MKKLLLACILLISACAAAPPKPSSSAAAIPLEKANLEMVLEEQQGVEITWEDAKDIRDYYRGGVQKKAEAEKAYAAKDYPRALDLHKASNDFLNFVLRYAPQDQCDFPLFEGTSILFFPNLLIADNDFKIGRIMQQTGHEGPARREWKNALRFAQKSLQAERTEWGLSLHDQILSQIKPKGKP